MQNVCHPYCVLARMQNGSGKHIAFLQSLQSACNLARMQFGSIHDTTFQGCKMLASTHIACLQECKMLASLTRMQNACIHPYCILARREKVICKLLMTKCVHLAFLQNAKCKMQRTAMGFTGFYGIPMHSMDPKPEAQTYLQNIMGFMIES